MTGRLTLLVLALAVLGAPTTAQGADPVRDALIAEDLEPRPLYPTSLPPRLRAADAEVSTPPDADYGVVWNRARRRGYVTLQRFPRSHLAETRRDPRTGGGKRVRLAGRTRYFICGHVCGYMWIQDGRTYGVFGTYYGHGEQGAFRDMRSVIRKLRRLPAPRAAAARACGSIEVRFEHTPGEDPPMRITAPRSIGCAQARRVMRRFHRLPCNPNGGNTCARRIRGGWHCSNPTAGSYPLVQVCSRGSVRIRGWARR